MSEVQIRDLIMKAREERAALRKRFVQNNIATVSLNLNIPGFPKSDSKMLSFFKIVQEETRLYLIANRISVNDSQAEHLHNEAGDFYVLPLEQTSHSIQVIKDKCEAFEEIHPLGRLIDIDVTNSIGEHISSHKQKKCYFCGEFSALECMHEKRHSYDIMRVQISEDIAKYLAKQKQKEISQHLVSFALRAILYEVSLTPKPGLVDIVNSGIHKDMDYYTFLDSSSSFSHCFSEIAELGFLYSGELSEALPLIRQLGLKMEKQMFESTGNVNTQKGIIFLMALATFSSAYCIAKNGVFDLTSFQQTSKEISNEILLEFEQSQEVTHGVQCANTYGFELGGGARYEASSGFKTTLNYGFPILQEEGLIHTNQAKKESTLTKALLSLMAHNNDTNVLYRSDLTSLEELKELSKQALNAYQTENYLKFYQKIDEFCMRKRVSPGGAADLLAVSVFIYFTYNKFNDAC